MIPASHGVSSPVDLSRARRSLGLSTPQPARAMQSNCKGLLVAFRGSGCFSVNTWMRSDQICSYREFSN